MRKRHYKLPIGILLVLTIVSFSQCKKDMIAAPDPDAKISKQLAATAGTVSAPQLLDLSGVVPDGGYGYKIIGNFGTQSDSNENMNASSLRLYENGVELQSPHNYHVDIREEGGGLYSHFGKALHFSTSDNTDPRRNGRTYTYTIGGSLVGRAPSAQPSPIQNSGIDMEKPFGYAMMNGETTGGQGGERIVVTNYYELKKALDNRVPTIVEISGKIVGVGYLNVRSNMTVVGRKGSVIEGVALLAYNVQNVIFRNLTIRNVIGITNIMIKESSHHVWVDHCDLSSNRDFYWGYFDGLLDIGNEASYVTVSRNKLHDNYGAFLIGFADSRTSDRGNLKVTVYGNYLYNISERQPCVRFGNMHVFNNYMRDGGYAIGSTMDATVRLDNNVFENIRTPIKTDFNARPGFVSGIASNLFKSCGENRLKLGESNWVPEYEYQSKLIPVDRVQSEVLANSGAILNL